MSFVMVDIESDGPIPGDYSMICFGAVIVRGDARDLDRDRLFGHRKAIVVRSHHGI